MMTGVGVRQLWSEGAAIFRKCYAKQFVTFKAAAALDEVLDSQRRREAFKVRKGSFWDLSNLRLTSVETAQSGRIGVVLAVTAPCWKAEPINAMPSGTGDFISVVCLAPVP